MNQKLEKILKISLKVANVLVILGAIGVLVYFFGYLNLEKYLMQKGFNLAVNSIVNEVKQTGQVQVSKDLILIPQTKVEVKK